MRTPQVGEAGAPVSALEPSTNALSCSDHDQQSAHPIDDMERGAGQLNPPLERGAWWSAFGDDTDGGIVTLDVAELDPPRCASRAALHMTAAGFAAWGANAHLALHPVQQADGGYAEGAFDAHAYGGVRFWARSGSRDAVAMRVDINDRQTSPEGGICDPDTNAFNRCHKPFIATFAVTFDWRQFELRFADFRQIAAWEGKQADEPLAIEALYNLGWTVVSQDARLQADVWIDDIAWLAATDVP